MQTTRRSCCFILRKAVPGWVPALLNLPNGQLREEKKMSFRPRLLLISFPAFLTSSGDNRLSALAVHRRCTRRATPIALSSCPGRARNIARIAIRFRNKGLGTTLPDRWYRQATKHFEDFTAFPAIQPRGRPLRIRYPAAPKHHLHQFHPHGVRRE